MTLRYGIRFCSNFHSGGVVFLQVSYKYYFSIEASSHYGAEIFGGSQGAKGN